MANNSDDKKALVSVQGSQTTIHRGEVDLNNLIIIEVIFHIYRVPCKKS